VAVIKFGTDGKGIEFGQRLAGFVVVALLVAAALTLNAYHLITDSIMEWAWGALGAAAVALPIARGIEKGGKK